MRSTWLLSLVVLSAFAVVPMHAAEEKKPEAKKEEKKEEKAERLWPRGPEIAKLKAEAGLADVDIHNIKAAVNEVDKKNEQVRGPESVKAAEEKVKHAKEALKAAEDELDSAKGGFDLLEERKKAAYNAVPAEKREKAQDIIKYKPKVEKAEKKAEVEKK